MFRRETTTRLKLNPMSPRLIGSATALIGIALAVPAVVAWREQGMWSAWSAAMLALGALLMVGGLIAVARGQQNADGRAMPASVTGALVLNAVFLALFALEISTGLTRERGVLAKSLFFFPPALAIFLGLCAARRWAWQLARALSLLGSMFFFAVAVMVCIYQPIDDRGPVWIWIALVSVSLGSLLFAGGFHALGRPSAARYFAPSECP